MKSLPCSNVQRPATLSRRLQTMMLWLFASHSILAAPGETNLFNLSIEQLLEIKVDTVSTAAKHEQKVTEAPSSVSIVTQDDVKKFGYRTLADIMRSVRGFDVSYDRNYAYLGSRGFNRPGDFGGRILLMIDGHRMNDGLFDSAAIAQDFLLDVDLIERVEVVRGPGSAIYGNNAFFGVVNVITKRGHNIGGVEVSGSVASYDSYQGRFTYGNRLTNGVEMLFSGTYYDSAGPSSFFYPGNGVANGLDADQAQKYFASLSWRDFSLEAGYNEREKHFPTASYGTVFGDPRLKTTDTRAFANLKFERDLENECCLLARVYYDYYRNDGCYPYTGSVLNVDKLVNHWMGAELQLSREFWDKLRLTLGTEVRYDLELVQENFDTTPTFVSYLEDHRQLNNVGVYAQSEYALLANLSLTGGVRYDYYSTFGDTVNPRAGIVYQPAKGTSLKALYGRAFRSPNGNELYYSGGPNTANPNLKPERIDTYELIAEQYFSRGLRTSVSGFYYHIDDLIAQSAANQYENLDSVHARGLELEVEQQWANKIRGRASFVMQETVNNATDRTLSNSPHQLAKFNLSAPLWRDKVFLGLELQGVSRRSTLPSPTTGITSSVGEYWLANATLYSQQLAPGLDVSLSVYNLFNRHYSDPGAAEHISNTPELPTIAQDGRTFRLKLTYHF